MAGSPLDALLERVRAEYLEMPGLRLKLEQVHRLFGVERPSCQRVLDALVDGKFLCANADGTYSRLSDGAMPQKMAAPGPDGLTRSTAG